MRRFPIMMTTMAMVLAWSIAAKAQIPGDLTGNGQVDIADLHCAVLASVQPFPPSCMKFEGVTDVNCDGKTDVADVQLMVMIVLNYPAPGIPTAQDQDGDNLHNACDNCPTVYNPDQMDFDEDGEGDACEQGNELCGNGTVDMGEECDDGNTDPGDGCSSVCLWESSYVPGDLVITEIMVQPKRSDSQLGEWFEIRSLKPADIPLHGFAIANGSGARHVINSPSLVIPAGETRVLGVSGNPALNGGFTPAYVYSGVPLGDSSGVLRLEGPGGLTVDQVAYSSATFQMVPGRSLSLSIFRTNHLDNDDPTAWCVATMKMSGGDYGTPGFINNTCSQPFVCGDGSLQPGEECDDSNTAPGDGCDSFCQLEGVGLCGNGTLDPGEECDDGNMQGADGCDPFCEIETYVCGNGAIEPGEECDDWNINNNDGCSSSCKLEISVCGNSVIEWGEACDDGNLNNGDGCNEFCLIEMQNPCGNGILEGWEECDDGNSDNNDGCDEFCMHEEGWPICGNGIIEEGEECDDGCANGNPGVCEVEIDDGDGCEHNCRKTSPDVLCGNGVQNDGEECDDGNKTPGDGCSDTCTTELWDGEIDGYVFLHGLTLGALDSVYVAAYPGTLTNPKNPGVAPTRFAILDDFSSPAGFNLKLPAGSYTVVAGLDVGGNNGVGQLGTEDKVKTRTVTIVVGDRIPGFSLVITNGTAGTGTITGQVTCISCGVTSSDSLRLYVSMHAYPDVDVIAYRKVKPVSFDAQGRYNYSISDVPVGTWYVMGFLDYGDNSQEGPQGNDKMGTFASSVVVNEGGTASGKNFTLNL